MVKRLKSGSSQAKQVYVVGAQTLPLELDNWTVLFIYHVLHCMYMIEYIRYIVAYKVNNEIEWVCNTPVRMI